MKKNRSLSVELETYEVAVKAVGAISRLFSVSDKPYLDSRFVEQLYVANSKAIDIGRRDVSFDAKAENNVGIGIKTFIADKNSTSKLEKIAEFNKDASREQLSKLKGKNLAVRVAELRNKRVMAHVNELGLELDKCIYHLLVRIQGGCFIVEEPYQLIDISKIKPTNLNGKVISSWSAKGAGPYFTDGNATYSFDISKSTLKKRFMLTKTGNNVVSDFIPVKIAENPLASLIEAHLGIGISNFNPVKISSSDNFVILPLYSTRANDQKIIPERSGINQWNAAGRQRTFGEAYVPVPASVRKIAPNFFPPRDAEFTLSLPNGKSIMAKVCQDDGKALMARKNIELMEWLYEIIDGDMNVAKKRLAKNNPYTYQDLIDIGMDSVLIRCLNYETKQYSIEMSSIDAFEEFIELRTS